MSINTGRPFGYIYRSSDEWWAEQALSAISQAKQEMFQAMQQEELQYSPDKRKSDTDLWNKVNASFNRAVRSL